ncbi:sulfate permease [Luteovulum azotoformans]|nr:sulfate permease [Cereibacter azotoformans]
MAGLAPRQAWSGKGSRDPASADRGQAVEKQAQMSLSIFRIYSFSDIPVKEITEKSKLQKELREN